MTSNGIEIALKDGARILLDERMIEPVIHINVIPSLDSDPENVRIKSWRVTEYTENKLSIEVVFEQPLSLSIGS